MKVEGLIRADGLDEAGDCLFPNLSSMVSALGFNIGSVCPHHSEVANLCHQRADPRQGIPKGLIQ